LPFATGSLPAAAVDRVLNEGQQQQVPVEHGKVERERGGALTLPLASDDCRDWRFRLQLV
jgi:hypothetical protein